MNGKLVIYNLLIDIYKGGIWGHCPGILTIDPKFQRDIQVDLWELVHCTNNLPTDSGETHHYNILPA